MSFHTGPTHALARRVNDWLEGKAANRCPLCGEHHSWDFSGVCMVYLVDPEYVGKAEHRRSRSSVSIKEEDPLRRLTSGHRLVRITCDNCGYVVLLDDTKVRGEPESDEVEEADF